MENQEEMQEYKGERSILLQEIKGTIILLNESAAKTEAGFRFISTTGKTKDVYPIAEFYTYFMSLYTLTREIIRDKNLPGKVEKWLTSVEYNKDTIWNTFKEGQNLSLNYQEELYKLGVKDTNITVFIGYPFTYFEQFIRVGESDGE